MAAFSLHFILLLMGFTFTVTQVMVMRETLLAFAGNELSVAIVLANWLLLQAAGGFVLGKRAEERGLGEAGYALVLLVLSVLLPLTVYGIRALRDLMGLAPGEGASLLQILLWTAPVLAPLGAAGGTLFALGCALHSRRSGKGALSIGRTYSLEALGAAGGGLLFTFVFIPFLNSFQVAALLGAANLLGALLLVSRSGVEMGRRRVFLAVWGPLLLGSLVLLFPPVSQMAEQGSLERLWRGFEVLESRGSPYGRVTAAEREERVSLFFNGVPVCAVPVPDVALAEELVHYPLLLSPSPERILIIGGGLGGVIGEALKHPLREIHYAEIDPLIPRLAREHAPELTREELGDPRVRVHALDGRRYVKTSRVKFQAVLLNLPPPSILGVNRFYTIDFFRDVFRLLADQGVLALTVPGSETDLPPEIRNLNLNILESLREVFFSVAAVPGERNLLLASPARDLEGLAPDRLIARLRERNIPTRFVNPGQIRRKMAEERLEWLEDVLGWGGGVRLNRDRNPSGMYYSLAHWNARFHPSFQAFWKGIGELRLFHVPLALLVLVICVAVGQKRLRSGKEGFQAPRGTLFWVVLTTGFLGAAMSVILILSFQTLYGYVYQWIGLLAAGFMAGLALGSWLMNRSLEKIRNWTVTLIGLEGFICLFGLVAIFILDYQYSAKLDRWSLWAAQTGFLFLILVSGFWVGLEFPLATLIYHGGRKREVARTAAILYGSDLLGAFAGALLAGAVFIPVWGILRTCAAVILIKLSSLVLLSIGDSRMRDGE